MASPTYRAMYKCRLCGKVFDGGKRTSFNVATMETAKMLTGYKSSLYMTEMHHCADGAIGVADFQGWMEEGGAADG